jgi:hypothetical protein
VRDGTAKPHYFSRDCISQQREVSGLAVTLPLDQPRAGTEIDPEQLA